VPGVATAVELYGEGDVGEEIPLKLPTRSETAISQRWRLRPDRAGSGSAGVNFAEAKVIARTVCCGFGESATARHYCSRLA